MKRKKTDVTVHGGWKILFTILLLFATFNLFDLSDDRNNPAFMTLLIYTFLFVFLSVCGSNSRVAVSISQSCLFEAIFFAPSSLWGFYVSLYFFLTIDKSVIAASFSVLLTLLSIPFALLLAKLQGGIKRWNTLISFLIFPIVIYLICYYYAETAIKLAIGLSLFALIACFVMAYIDNGRKHKADYASAGKKASRSNCSACWDDRPMSDVSNKVIHLKGTIIVKYTGEFSKHDANDVVHALIQDYVKRVARDMPGYSVDSASVNIRYLKLD